MEAILGLKALIPAMKRLLEKGRVLELLNFQGDYKREKDQSQRPSLTDSPELKNRRNVNEGERENGRGKGKNKSIPDLRLRGKKTEVLSNVAKR